MKAWPGWTRVDRDTLRHDATGSTVVVRERHPVTGTPTRVRWFARGDCGACKKICDAVERVHARLERRA